MKSKSYADFKSGKTFLELTVVEAHILLDGLLLDEKIHISLDKPDIPCEPFDDRYEICNLHEE
jgi:hypothetical protein